MARYVIAGLCLAAVLLAACSDGAPASEPTAVPTPTPTPAPTSEAPTEGGDVEAAIREDGRHAVHLHGLDVEARTLALDPIQWLSGEAARRAYEEETGDPGGPPNDYMIRNTDPTIWTLDVAAEVEVTLVRLHEDGDADSDPGAWEELPDYFAAQPTDGAALSWSPFWVTVEDQVIVAIEEQYTP